MKVQLERQRHGSPVLGNLWPLYVHDLSEIDPKDPNRHGILGEDDGVRTLAEQSLRQDAWFSDPAALFPYIITANGKPVGFNLIAARSRLPSGIDADFVVHEFFVLRAFRGVGVGEQAARDGFDAHRGRWEVVTPPQHARAIEFWRRVIERHVGEYSESEVDHPWGPRVAFHFDNLGPRAATVGSARGQEGSQEER